MQVRPQRVPALQSRGDAVNAGHVRALVLKRAEQAIPQNEDAAVVLVDVLGIARVMHAMVGRRDENPFQRPEAADVLRVHPELIDEIQAADGDHRGRRHAREIQRNVEHEADVVGARLAQRRAEVELFALVMRDVRGPHDAPLVAEAMLPVVTEVVRDERRDPLPRGIHRPLVHAQPFDQRTEYHRRKPEPQHVDQAAERAQLQAVHRVRETIGLALDELAVQELDEHRQDEEWNCDFDVIHAPPARARQYTSGGHWCFAGGG